jgi:hypothetical protein
MTAGRLRINLPPPITQRFSNAWPHAGSWQDALYGYYDETDGITEQREGVRSRRSSAEMAQGGDGLRKTSLHSSPLKNRVVPTPEPENSDMERTENGDRVSGLRETGTSPSTPTQPQSAAKKPRRQKVRRYRTALIPPTPAGLGFTPTERESLPAWKEGRIDNTNEGGFDWTNPNGRQRDVNDDDLEKNEPGFGRRTPRYFWIFGGNPVHPKGGKTRMVDEDFRKRVRRYIFLDARVTVWIRLINLGVVVGLLGKPDLPLFRSVLI